MKAVMPVYAYCIVRIDNRSSKKSAANSSVKWTLSIAKLCNWFETLQRLRNVSNHNLLWGCKDFQEQLQKFTGSSVADECSLVIWTYFENSVACPVSRNLWRSGKLPGLNYWGRRRGTCLDLGRVWLSAEAEDHCILFPDSACSLLLLLLLLLLIPPTTNFLQRATLPYTTNHS